jgi:GTP pyrophosphokinase
VRHGTAWSGGGGILLAMSVLEISRLAMLSAAERNSSMYTSVHYVVKQNSTNRRLCELQIRTLAEEVWGEISHTINYPHETDSVACKEQLKVLARLVSGCSRLVDSIVASYAEHNDNG